MWELYAEVQVKIAINGRDDDVCLVATRLSHVLMLGDISGKAWQSSLKIQMKLWRHKLINPFVKNSELRMCGSLDSSWSLDTSRGVCRHIIVISLQ